MPSWLPCGCFVRKIGAACRSWRQLRGRWWAEANSLNFNFNHLPARCGRFTILSARAWFWVLIILIEMVWGADCLAVTTREWWRDFICILSVNIFPSSPLSLPLWCPAQYFRGQRIKNLNNWQQLTSQQQLGQNNPGPGCSRWRDGGQQHWLWWCYGVLSLSLVATGQCPGDRGNDRYRLLLLLFVKCSSSSSGQDSGGRSPCFDTDHDVTMIARCDVFL